MDAALHKARENARLNRVSWYVSFDAVSETRSSPRDETTPDRAVDSVTGKTCVATRVSFDFTQRGQHDASLGNGIFGPDTPRTAGEASRKTSRTF